MASGRIQMGIKSAQGGFVTTRLNKILAWARTGSLWPLTIGLSCCAIEMMQAAAARYDLDRFGVMFRASPRQADLLIVSGTVCNKMIEPLKRVYEQMPEPKWVIAMGACACTGGIYADSYSVVAGVDKIIPVDVFLPGCPPTPEELIDAILLLQKKIKDEH